MKTPLFTLASLSAILLATQTQALTIDPEPNTGVSIDQITYHAPINWVSIEQIQKSLEGPPDDCGIRC